MGPGRAARLGALPFGLVLLDVDVKGGKQGEQQLAQLQAQHGQLPTTASQRTPSGGHHLLFRLPEPVAWFHGAVPLDPQAPRAKADIDICHVHHRYMTIYQEAIFDQEIATLPKSWVKLVAKNTSAKQTSPETRGRSAPTDTDDLWGRLIGAEKGDRNNALNNAVFLLARDGLWDNHQESRVTELARLANVGEEAIEATVKSAVTDGQRQRKKPDDWYRALESDDRLLGRRNRRALLKAGHPLREVAVLHGMRIGLSVRDLAERMGVSHTAASHYMRDLRDFGHLKRDSAWDKSEAPKHQLVTPGDCIKGDSPPVTSTPTLSSRKTTGGLSPLVYLAPSWMDRHDAFNRMPGCQWLPKSCAPVLALVAEKPYKVKNLAQLTGLSVATVRRCAHILESAALVTYDCRHSKLLEPCFTDLKIALDQWAKFSHAEGNYDSLKARHVLHRALRDAPRPPRPRRRPGDGRRRR